MSGRWFRLYDTVVDDPKAQRLSDAAFRAWINLLCVASRTGGVIGGDVRELSFRLRKPEARVRELVEQLLANALLDRVGGDYQPHDWDAYQYKGDTSRDRMRRLRARVGDGDAPDDVTHQVTGPESETEQSRTEQKARAARFHDFWKICPRKVGRGAAEKSYFRALELADADVLDAAITVYAAAMKGRDPTFVCHPATWLNQQRWLDEGATPVDANADAEAGAAWGGAAAPLVARIGAASFHAFFGAATFDAGPPVRITVTRPHLRALIERKYQSALRLAFGDYELVP